jgi:ATP-dependent DNA helicase
LLLLIPSYSSSYLSHSIVYEYGADLIFLPQIPVLMYHGTPAERAEMRRTTLALPDDWPPPKDPTPAPAPAPVKGKGRGTAARLHPFSFVFQY